MAERSSAQECESRSFSLARTSFCSVALCSYLQHSVFSAASARLRFVSPGTSFILMHEDGQSNSSSSGGNTLARRAHLDDDYFSKLRRSRAPAPT